jgi:hypothetical protein
MSRTYQHASSKQVPSLRERNDATFLSVFTPHTVAEPVAIGIVPRLTSWPTVRSVAQCLRHHVGIDVLSCKQ